MKADTACQARFFSEMSEHQILAREFFSTVLLDSLHKNFGWEKAVISYFDTKGKFLSWTSWRGILLDCKEHPYRKFAENDIDRYKIYNEAVKTGLTYFNVTPQLYKATDIITAVDYEQSAHVKFLEENFNAHYSMTLAFGINAYIQVSFLKTKEEGDFTPEEIEELNEIYVYVANAYKNFKKYEQVKIVTNIQNKIIASGEKAYLITDDFMHVMSCNQPALDCLKDILGSAAVKQISSETPCNWLPFLLGSDAEETGENEVLTRVIKQYTFHIYTYDQTYSNGIVDRYHWITISHSRKGQSEEWLEASGTLTPTEQKVAELMHQGLTYQKIADELVVSYHTIKKHVQNIYSKCGVNSRFELYKWLENREK